MNYGKNGIILDSQKPFVSEIGKVYVIGFIGGIIGFIISFVNGHSIFEAFIAAAFLYLGAFAISDIAISGIKYTALQLKDYDLPGRAVSPEELYDRIYHKLSAYGRLEIINRNLIFIHKGLEYRVIIDYEKSNFRIIITKRFVFSLNPYNDLRTCRYNKAIVNIPRIVFAIQQAVLDINGANNSTQENVYKPAQKIFRETDYDNTQTNSNDYARGQQQKKGTILPVISIIICILLAGFVWEYFDVEESNYTIPDDDTLNYNSTNEIEPNYDMPDYDVPNYDVPNYDMPNETVSDYNFYENSIYNFSLEYPASVYIREEKEESVIFASNDDSGVFTVACFGTGMVADENTFEYYSNAVMANYYKKAQKESLKYNVYYPENNVYAIESTYVGAQTGKQWKLNFALIVLDGNMYYIGGLYEFDDNISENIFKNIFDSFARNKELFL